MHLELFWPLLNQAERIRRELTALGGLEEEFTADRDPAALSAIAQGLRARRGALTAIADTVETGRPAGTIPDPAPLFEQAVTALRAVLAVAQRATDRRVTACLAPHSRSVRHPRKAPGSADVKPKTNESIVSKELGPERAYCFSISA